VFAWGWLCLPKNLKLDERRPVVVCQHGLEGLPEDTITDDRSSPAWGSYKSFALRLAEQGFITFAPHNPYRGRDAFRTLQRKLNPLGLTLYSVINGQHQRILEWLKAQTLRSTTLPRKADSDRRHGSMRASGRSRGCRRAPTAAACRRVTVPAKKLRRLQLSAGASRPDFLEWASVPSGPGQRSSLTRAHHVATDVYRPAAWASP
jgi:hypothetical protein